MNQVKKMLFLVVIGMVFVISACSEDECVAPGISENIIGSWKVTAGTGVVEFKTDGTFTDPDDDLIGGEINGEVLDQKTYSVTTDSLFVEAASATSSNAVSAAFPVEGNECDKITVSLIGTNVDFIRQ